MFYGTCYIVEIDFFTEDKKNNQWDTKPHTFRTKNTTKHSASQVTSSLGRGSKCLAFVRFDRLF